MKLSTKGKYGVRAVFEIARHYGNGPITIKEIAERQGISFSYLEQIAEAAPPFVHATRAGGAAPK